MDQPLGRKVGNALEVMEAVDMLRGEAPDDYTEITYALTAEMLVLGKKAATVEEAREKLRKVVEDGSAVRKLKEIVQVQGGDPRAIDDYSLLPQAKSTVDVVAPRDGWVTAIDTEGVGLAGVALGAGRQRVDSKIDPAVGFTLLKKTGESVTKGEPVVRVHYNDAGPVADVKARLLAAYKFGDAASVARPLVRERVE
jgi:pyrimidine-nucleoside phosphorylase